MFIINDSEDRYIYWVIVTGSIFIIQIVSIVKLIEIKQIKMYIMKKNRII